MLRYAFWCLVTLISALSATVSADELDLKAGYPQRYVVKKGDTLWDISEKYLNTPWRWPELWQVNPQIADPHWIYPGDVLQLIFVDGMPRLVKQGHKKQLKSSPRGRKQLKDGPIPTVPLSHISHYLTHRKVLLGAELEGMPMITGGERKSIFYAKGDTVFVNAALPQGGVYGVYRQGRTLYRPDSGEFLGQEVVMVATGRIRESGALSRVELLSSDEEVRPGQRLMVLSSSDMLPAYFQPRSPTMTVLGRIVALDSGVREVGKNAVVVLDQGIEQGAQVGQVLSVYHPGDLMMSDPQGIPRYPEDIGAYENLMAYFVADNNILQPDVYRGNLMIFSTFERVSYAIVTALSHPIRAEDLVSNP